MLDMYILKNGEVVKAKNEQEWSAWFENIDNRRIDYTEINDEVYVSTVCLGIDHRFGREGAPVIFESMAFGLGNERQDRYCTVAEAKEGHERMVKEIMAELGIKECFPRGKKYRRIDSEWKISQDE